MLNLKRINIFDDKMNQYLKDKKVATPPLIQVS